MTDRPDYIACVQQTHETLKGTSWCGRDVSREWAFTGASHAAENGRKAGNLVACPECVARIVRALHNGHGE